MSRESKNSNYLTETQKDQIRTWIRAGYTAPQIVGLARNQGFEVTEWNIWTNYMPQVKKEFKDHIDRNSLSKSWFNKEFRAERAAEISQMLYEHIMNGDMFQEEVIETSGKDGVQITHKPLYFAGMIKNYLDMNNLIGNELGQRRAALDVNFNKNQNLNLSVLVDKIYEQEEAVEKKIEGADIIDLPPGPDFADEKGFMQIVEEQTDEEIKALAEHSGEEDDNNVL